MKEIKCTIIQDVLPLYIDDVVSNDTKDMVDEHLQHCENCKKEYEFMKRELYIPVENKVSLINKISKKWRTKKVMISIVSVLVTASILFGAFAYVFYYRTVIPYSEELVKIEERNDNQLVALYYGESYAKVNTSYVMQLEIDGVKKNVNILYFEDTIASKLVDNKTNPKGLEFPLPESEKVDAVYYVEYDSKKVTDGKDSWDSIMKRADLIWEK